MTTTSEGKRVPFNIKDYSAQAYRDKCSFFTLANLFNNERFVLEAKAYNKESDINTHHENEVLRKVSKGRYYIEPYVRLALVPDKESNQLIDKDLFYRAIAFNDFPDDIIAPYLIGALIVANTETNGEPQRVFIQHRLLALVGKEKSYIVDSVTNRVLTCETAVLYEKITSVYTTILDISLVFDNTTNDYYIPTPKELNHLI